MDFNLILTIPLRIHITECLTVIEHSQQNTACELEKVYHCKDFEELLNFVRIKQNGDRDVTYINRLIGLILKNVKWLCINFILHPIVPRNQSDISLEFQDRIV